MDNNERAESDEARKYLQRFVNRQLKQFTNEGKKKLLKGKNLNEKLRGTSEDKLFIDFLQRDNMVKVVFLSYLWDSMLEAFFLNPKAGEETKVILDNRLTNFVKEALKTQSNLVQVSFLEVVKTHNTSTLKQLEITPCYEVPAFIRLIAPKNRRISEDSRFTEGKEWCLNVLKGLPLHTIVEAWVVIELNCKQRDEFFPNGYKSVRSGYV